MTATYTSKLGRWPSRGWGLGWGRGQGQGRGRGRGEGRALTPPPPASSPPQTLDTANPDHHEGQLPLLPPSP